MVAAGSGRSRVRVRYFVNIIFFGLLFFREGDISNRTEKSDFRVRRRHPHAKIMIFADEVLSAGHSSARENFVDRTEKPIPY